MYQVIAAKTEVCICFVPKIQDGAAYKAKGGDTLEEADRHGQGGKQGRAGAGQGESFAVEILLSLLYFCDESFSFVENQFSEGQFAPDGLGVPKAAIPFLEPVGDLFQALRLSVSEKVGQEKTQGDVIVREGFGLPCLVQGIDRHAAGVQGEKYGLFMAALVKADVVSKPALHAAALIVIGSAALFPEILTGLEAVDVEIPDIRADLVKLSDEFFVLGHGLGVPFVLCFFVCIVSG